MTEFSPTVTAWLERWQALVWETPSAGRAIRLFCEKDTFVLISAIWNTNNSTNKHWNFCRVALFIERFVTLTNHGVFVTMYECLFRRIYKYAIINFTMTGQKPWNAYTPSILFWTTPTFWSFEMLWSQRRSSLLRLCTVLVNPSPNLHISQATLGRRRICQFLCCLVISGLLSDPQFVKDKTATAGAKSVYSGEIKR